MGRKKLSKEELIERIENYENENPNGYTAQQAYKYRIALKKYLDAEEPPEDTEETTEETETIEGGEIVIKDKLKSWLDVIKLDFKKPKDRHDYLGAIIGVVGNPRMGKTHIQKEIAKQYKNDTFIFDILDEWRGYNRYNSKYTAYPEVADEFNEFVEWYSEKFLRVKPTLLVMDEAELLAPNGKTGSKTFRNIVPIHRHELLNIMWASQRPQEVDIQLTDKTHYMICFKVNERAGSRLEEKKKGLGKMAMSLKEREYIIYSALNDTIYDFR